MTNPPATSKTTQETTQIATNHRRGSKSIYLVALLGLLSVSLFIFTNVEAQQPETTTPPTGLDRVTVVPSPTAGPTPPGTSCPGPRRLHVKSNSARYWPGLYRDRVVFKLLDHLNVELVTPADAPPRFQNRETGLGVGVGSRAADGRFGGQVIGGFGHMVQGNSQDLEFLNQAIGRSRPLHVLPNFSSSRQQLQQFRAQAEKRSCHPLAHLEQYYVIYLQPGVAGEIVANQLNSSPLVEIAYLPPIPRNSDRLPTTPSFESSQGYLDSANAGGIDAKYAWKFTGGRGAATKIIDVEATWNINHEDLPRPYWYSGTRGVNRGAELIGVTQSILNLDLASLGIDVHHGTAVAGVLVAKRDGHGVTGIASDANWGAASVIRRSALAGVFGGTSGIHDASVSDAAMLAAVSFFVGREEGHVILIEQHSPGPPSGLTCPPTVDCSAFEFVPMEYFPDCFDAFQTITNLGTIVVEAAGNGNMNLDSNIYEERFNRAVRDSGAILVGASLSNARTPNSTTNSGSRVDVHAWGQNVATTGYGDVKVNGPDIGQFYATNFSGTSSASPIVAGAILSIQGILRASNQPVLPPEEMRALLVSTGQPQTPPPGGQITRRIGPMPNLRNALRDFDTTTTSVGGTGGRAFNLRCPKGQALIGIKGRAGAVVDQLQGICGNPAGLGSETDSVGGGGGKRFVALCKNNRVVVGLRGRAGWFIDQIEIDCARFEDGIWNSRLVRVRQGGGGDGGSEFGPIRCSTDRIGVGLKGGAEAFLDRVQLICSSDEPDTDRNQWISQPVGSATGEESRMQCETGHAMVGVTANTGGWFDNIGPICVRVNADGTWDGRTFPTEGTNGGDGGTPISVMCAANEAITGIGGRAGDHLYRLQIHCRPLLNPRTSGAEETLLPAFGGWGGEHFRQIDCRGNLPASGFIIRSGDYVNQLALICGHAE